MSKSEELKKLKEELKKKKVHTCEVYSRVVGYMRPVNQWNEGKRAEFVARKTFEKSI